MADTADITRILNRIRDGDTAAPGELLPFVYTEIRRRAGYAMRGQPRDHTLQPTALVNEAYIRLFRDQTHDWHGRSHFLRAATTAMRHVLVDHARRKNCDKRTPREEEGAPVYILYEKRALDILALNEALDALADTHPRHAEIVGLRFFGGATIDEVSELTVTTKRTVERRFAFAKAWLKDRLDDA